MALPFCSLHFTNQYNSVSNTNHEANLYVTPSSLLLPSLSYV